MSRVLIVIPHDRFRDEELTEMSAIFRDVGITFNIGSSHHTDAHGHFGMLVKPDVDISFVSPSDYDALIFLGGRGVDEYLQNGAVLSMVQEFSYQQKIIAALGMASEILANAGVLTGKKATCDAEAVNAIQAAGAYYTGRLVEEDGNILTGMGVKATKSLTEDLVKRLS